MAFITKFFLMLFGSFTWEKVASLILKFGQKKLDGYLGEITLPQRVKMFIRLLYLLAGELGHEWSNDTKMTNIDNECVEFVLDTAQSLAEKHDFKLPLLLD